MSRKSKRFAKKEMACTRRELLQTGASSATFFAMPSILTGILKAENAQASGIDEWSSGQSFIHMHLSGGASVAHWAEPQDADGNPITGTSTLAAIGQADDATSRVTALGNLNFFNDSGFMRGLSEVASPAELAQIKAMMFCGTSGDDNSSGAKYGFIAANAYAGLISAVSSVAGLSNTPSGNNTFPLCNAAGKDFIFAQNVNSVIRAAAFSTSLTDTKYYGVIANGMKRIHDAQLPSSSQETGLAGYFRNMVSGLSQKLIDKVSPGSGTSIYEMNPFHNPATDTAGAAVAISPVLSPTPLWNTLSDDPNDARNNLSTPTPVVIPATTVANIQNSTANDTREAAVVYNCLKGNIGAVSYAYGGYDYHGNSDASTYVKDWNAGRRVGRACVLAIRMNRPLWFALTTDGGLSVNSGFNRTLQPGSSGVNRWQGDRRAYCRTYLFLVNVPNVMNKHVFGHCNTNGTTNDNTPVAQDYQVSAVIIYNFMRANGRPDADIKKVLKAMNLTDNQVTDIMTKVFIT